MEFLSCLQERAYLLSLQQDERLRNSTSLSSGRRSMSLALESGSPWSTSSWTRGAHVEGQHHCVTVGDCKTIFCRQAELFKNFVADNREQIFLASSYKSVGVSMHIFQAALLSACFHVASRPLGMRVRISTRSTIYSFFARGTWFTGIADASFCVLFCGSTVFLDFVYWLNLKLVSAPNPFRMAMARASSLASLWPGCTLCSCCRVRRVSFK